MPAGNASKKRKNIPGEFKQWSSTGRGYKKKVTKKIQVSLSAYPGRGGKGNPETEGKVKRNRIYKKE